MTFPKKILSSSAPSKLQRGTFSPWTIPSDGQKQINISRTRRTKYITGKRFSILCYAFKNYICCRCFHTRGHFCFMFKAQNRLNLFYLNHNGTLDKWEVSYIVTDHPSVTEPGGSPNTHTQCACTYNTHNSRTLKRTAGGWTSEGKVIYTQKCLSPARAMIL